MPNRLNVLCLLNGLSPRRGGGDESRVLSFWGELDKNRFHQIVAVAARVEEEAKTDEDSLYRRFLEAGASVAQLAPVNSVSASSLNSGGWIPKGGSFLNALKNLCSLIRKNKIDILDVHLSGLAGVLGFCASRVTGVPLVITLYHPPEYLKYRIFGQLFVGMADAIITDSQRMRDEISKWLIRSDPNMTVIPSGIFPPAPSRSPQEMRKILNLPVDPGIQVIGQVGRLVPFKGQMVLLEAAPSVLKEFPNTVFLLLGYATPKDTTFEERLHRRAEALGIAEQVRICGYPGRIGDVWQVMDIHAHASMFDSLPIAIIEGMSLGKPAVVTSAGGIPELVQHGITGIVVTPGDAQALSEGLLTLLRNPEAARELGIAAQRRYVQLYSPGLRTRQLEELFLEVYRRRNNKADVLVGPLGDDRHHEIS